MKPEHRNTWNQDDHQLAAEFTDVTAVWAVEKKPVPNIPHQLDRQVRKLAHYDAGADLQKNWLFGYGPQLATAASIFFAIGVFFVISLETQPPAFIQPGKLSSPEIPNRARQTADQREMALDELRMSWEKRKSRTEAIRLSRGNSWVRVSYTVNPDGGATSIEILDSCLWQAGRCVDDDIHHADAIAKIKRTRFEQPGKHEEVVVIPSR